MRPKKLIPAFCAVAGVLSISACAGSRLGTPSAPAPTGSMVLYLVGDAGEASPEDPLIEHLRSEVRHAAEDGDREVLVVFLGDNIYDDGLRLDQPRDTARLNAQAEVVRGTDAAAIFLPGNHDWDDSGPDGLQAIRRQGAHLSELRSGDLDVRLSPIDGCPGPESFDFANLRLITLDSQWFLHKHERGMDCGGIDSPEAFADSLGLLFESGGGRDIIVASHHPLATFGPHGGYFALDRHLFPLRDVKGWLFLPLPVFGTAYTLVRAGGISDQDLSGDKNLAYQELLEGIFRASETPSLLAHAAGHEHAQQVLDGEDSGVPYLLVSGSGSRTSPVNRDTSTLLASDERGYMRLEWRGDGSVRLVVLQLGSDGLGEPLAWCRQLRVRGGGLVDPVGNSMTDRQICNF